MANSPASTPAPAIFGLGVIVGPAFGPTLGGFITDNVGWRWIFFINLPIGILAITAAIIFLNKDKHNAEMDRRVDWLGIFLLSAGLGPCKLCWRKDSSMIGSTLP
jgi:DHA2 family multidrug resistance protein